MGPNNTLAVSANYNDRWFSCVKPNGTTYGTSIYDSPSPPAGSKSADTPGSAPGDYTLSGLSARAPVAGKTPMNLDFVYKSSIY